MNPKKIHALGCDLGDGQLQDILDHITSLPSLAFPIVCLPDLHLKERTEGPSSFAAATTDTIVPELTAPSVGCGMGAIITSLTVKDVNHEFFQKFYELMRRDLGPRYGHFRNLLLWLGIINRPKNAYDLTTEEFEHVIREGASAAINKYELPAETLDRVEYQGSLFTEEEKKTLSLKSILPRVSYRSGRHDLGYGFKGNHFLEIQYVEEMIDVKTARDWGLRENQIIIMYHGGGGAVSYHIGRYFGNRKKNTFRQKIILTLLKILFHFGNPRDWKYARERLRYYFFPRPFMEISLDSPEGTRLMLATKASLNYSYAFRIGIIQRIANSLVEALPTKKPTISLLWDGAHNAVVEEIIHGKKVVVHRHTANRVFDRKPVIVSGFNTTNSYIGVGLPGAQDHLFASDHGAGITIKKMEADGITTKHPKNYTTHIYQTKPPFKKVVHHMTNEGIDFVMDKLAEENIIKPVARLRPLAVFKG